MNDLDKKLDALFRTLPRERASRDFTQRCLLQYAEKRHAVFVNRRFVIGFGAAAATAAVLVVSIAWHVHSYHEKQRLRAECDAIRHEYAALLEQHDSYRRDLAEFAVLRYDEDPAVELVLDLSTFDPTVSMPEENTPSARVPLFGGDRSGKSAEGPFPLIYSGGSI